MKGREAPFAVGAFLLTTIRADLFQLTAHRRDRISARPEMLPCDVAIPSGTLSRDGHSTLVLEIPKPRRHRLLRRYLDAEVHVIRQQMTCNNPAFLLSSPLVKDRSACLTKVPTQGCTPPFGDEDDVILAMPSGMRQALLGFGPGVLLVWPHQATRGELYSCNAQSCSSRTGRTSGLPQRLSYRPCRPSPSRAAVSAAGVPVSGSSVQGGQMLAETSRSVA